MKEAITLLCLEADREADSAKMESARNKAEDAYFSARPQIDCSDKLNVFDVGFERGWAARDAERIGRRVIK